MPAPKMHADDIATDVALVRRLLAAQFPQWAALPLAPVASAGTDNALYQLGDDLAVRLSRIAGAVGQIAKEHRRLPRLAPQLPLAIPVPLAQGTPAKGYPPPWSVYRWLAGAEATRARIPDPRVLAMELAVSIAALQRIDPTAGPPSSRGVPLAARDTTVRSALAALDGLIDTGAARAAWGLALRVPVWSGPPVWSHGDLQAGNLLLAQGRLSAAIDFGCLGVGDPACELIVAWNLLPPDARAVFRATLAVVDATWARGRGWALSIALIALPCYRHTNPLVAEQSRRTIAAALTEA